MCVEACEECRPDTESYNHVRTITLVALNAAIHGHLGCLRYARNQGAQCDDDVIFRAAVYGHMECMKFAHAEGAPLDGKLTPRAFVVSDDNWDCFRYISLYLPSWPDIPPKMAAWRDRLRTTAAVILRIVRRNRARRAAITIQRFWLDRHYAPGGHGHALALTRLGDHQE